jgi:3-oxoacyl-[acyl-carrier-protein] synthase-3
MNYYIKHIEYYLPEKVIDNQFLQQNAGIEPDFLENKIGIKKRHIAAIDESTSAMAAKAGKMLLEKNSIPSETIDLLLLCTQNPDYNLPTTACIVQNLLSLPTTCAAFDINLGCSGFVYASAIAGNFIISGMVQRALLIMVDQYSKHIDYKDKNTASLFGDAASAILLEPCNDNYGFLDFSFGTNGEHFNKLIIPNSGVVIDPEKNKFLFMDGREIFKFSVSVVPENVKNILLKNNLSIDDISYFIFHQANKYMLTEIQKRLNIPENKMIIDLENYGNTVSSTIPIAFKNLINSGKVKNENIVLFCGFGVGLSWATTIYKYENYEYK